jgi:hypothetical protein
VFVGAGAVAMVETTVAIGVDRSIDTVGADVASGTAVEITFVGDGAGKTVDVGVGSSADAREFTPGPSNAHATTMGRTGANHLTSAVCLLAAMSSEGQRTSLPAPKQLFASVEHGVHGEEVEDPMNQE